MKFTTSAIALICASGGSAFMQQSPTTSAKNAALTFYLDDDMSANAAPAPRAAPAAPAGFGNYLDSMTSTSFRDGGAGIVNYLDSINQQCNGAQGPSAWCAEAITGYMTAVASEDSPIESSSEAAKAIGSYLDRLAGVAATHVGGPGIQSYLSTVARTPERVGGTGIASYLDSMGRDDSAASAPAASASAVKSYLDALSSGNAPAPVAPAVQEFLSHVSSGAVSAPTSGGGIASYLSSLAVNPNQLSGAGILSYTALVPINTERQGGAGITSYLDSIGQACDAVQPDNTGCAEAVSDYAIALSSGDASAESTNEAAQRIGGYLDALGSRTARTGGPGIGSYLSSMTTNSAIDGASATAVKSYLDSVSSGGREAASAPVFKDLIDSVSSGAIATGTGINDYLSTLPVTNDHPGGPGIQSYLASVPSNSARLGGAGLGSYLDSISQACEASQPTSDCAEAISNYMDALSSGDASADSSFDAAQRIGGYLDHLASDSPLSGGAGIQSYLATIGSNSALKGSASAVMSYLDALSAGVLDVPSAPAVQDYLSDVSSGAASVPTSGSGMASYLAALGSSTSLSGGAGILSYLDTIVGAASVMDTPAIADAVNGAIAPTANGAHAPGTPTTKIDTQVSHDGLQTTITITSVTTVVIDDEK